MKERYYIYLIIAAAGVYFVSSIESDLIRILIGTPTVLLGIYSLNKLLKLPKHQEKLLIRGGFLWVLLFVAIFLIAMIIRRLLK